MTKGDLERIEKITSLCDNCKFAACEQCEISWNDIQAIKHLYEENQKLREENKAVWSKNTEIEYDLEKARDEIYELAKAGIETAFDDSNKDTEILCRVLLKYNKIKLENGFYQRDPMDWEENFTLVGFEMDREKMMYIGDDESKEYIEQLEYKLKKAEKEIEELKEYKWKYEDLCD